MDDFVCSDSLVKYEVVLPCINMVEVFCIVCLHGLFSQAPSILRNLRSVICGVGKDECEKSAYQKEGSYRIEIISLFEGVNRALRGD